MPIIPVLCLQGHTRRTALQPPKFPLQFRIAFRGDVDYFAGFQSGKGPVEHFFFRAAGRAGLHVFRPGNRDAEGVDDEGHHRVEPQAGIGQEVGLVVEVDAEHQRVAERIWVIAAHERWPRVVSVLAAFDFHGRVVEAEHPAG